MRVDEFEAIEEDAAAAGERDVVDLDVHVARRAVPVRVAPTQPDCRAVQEVGKGDDPPHAADAAKGAGRGREVLDQLPVGAVVGRTLEPVTVCRFPPVPRERWLAGPRVSERLEGRSPCDNARFVVTNLRHTAEEAHQIYRERGDSEIQIKELEHDLAMGRPSCTRFLPISSASCSPPPPSQFSTSCACA